MMGPYLGMEGMTMLLRLTFSFFLMTQQTHVTVYYYFLTRSYDSFVQIHSEDSVSIFSCLLMITQHAY